MQPRDGSPRFRGGYRPNTKCLDAKQEGKYSTSASKTAGARQSLSSSVPPIQLDMHAAAEAILRLGTVCLGTAAHLRDLDIGMKTSCSPAYIQLSLDRACRASFPLRFFRFGFLHSHTLSAQHGANSRHRSGPALLRRCRLGGGLLEGDDREAMHQDGMASKSNECRRLPRQIQSFQECGEVTSNAIS